MKFFYLAGLLLLSFLNSEAQKYQEAIVTDVHCFRQENTAFNLEEELPFYFHHQEFINDVHNEIAKQLELKFGIKSVDFLSPGEISLSSTGLAPNLQAREYALNHTQEKTLFVEVLSKLNLRMVTDNIARYGFTTRVKAYNSKGKLVYKHSTTIPFESYHGDAITGPAVLGENDFYAFYLDGIDLAFEGKVKKAEIRYVQKPAADYYDEMIRDSDRYVFVPVKKGFAFGITRENAAEVLTFRENFWRSMDDEFNFGIVFNDQNFKDGYNLSNHITQKEYLVVVEGDINSFFDFLSFTSNVKVEFKEGKKKVVGDFELVSMDTLRGTIHGNEYTVNYNAPYNCSEFYAGNTCLALMRHDQGHDIVYLHRSVSDQQRGELFNVFFAWQYSTALQQAIDDYEASEER